MTDLKEILKECVKLYNSGKCLEAFKKWKEILETEIEANSYE